MRQRSQLCCIGYDAVLAKGSHERLPVNDFHVGLRAVPEWLVRSNHNACGLLDVLHRISGDAPAAAPSSVIQENDPPPVVKDGFVQRRH
jgi:hypothetical protein